MTPIRNKTPRKFITKTHPSSFGCYFLSTSFVLALHLGIVAMDFGGSNSRATAASNLCSGLGTQKTQRIFGSSPGARRNAMRLPQQPAQYALPQLVHTTSG